METNNVYVSENLMLQLCIYTPASIAKQCLRFKKRVNAYKAHY